MTHAEIRGPGFKGSLRGGTKTLFRLSGGGPRHSRLVITEAPIDTLSVAAIEGIRADTLYAATGGGTGPGTVQAIERLLGQMAEWRDALLAGATDANRAGERYAAQHAELPAAAGIAFERLAPPLGNDWNDVLVQRRPRCITNRAWVLLPSGRRLDLLNPDPQAWADHDLSVGLSRTYRWAGYSAWDLPLSVAQHSLTVLAIRQASPGPGLTPPEALRELLHDAEEALLGGWDPITRSSRSRTGL